jgi:hypothetical protein
MNKYYTIKNFIYSLLVVATIWTLCWIAVFKGGLRVPTWVIGEQFDANGSFLCFLLIGSLCGAYLLAFVQAFSKSSVQD